MTATVGKLHPRGASPSFSVWIALFSLLSLSVGLGFADVRPLVVLRGVGLEKREACKQKHVVAIQYNIYPEGGRGRKEMEDGKKGNGRTIDWAEV